MNIFLIEDDPKVQSFIHENLSSEGYAVTAFERIPAFDQGGEEPALIVLDRLIGNQDTKDHLLAIKRRFPKTLILILSALNSPHEKAQVLDLGADDYLGKPFSVIELSARVRSLLRRGNRTPDYRQVGDLIFNVPERTVTSHGRRVDLTNKEFQVLKCLSTQAGKVFTKFQLLDLVWESNLELESNVLEVTIMNLRRKLVEGRSTVEIQSKRNVGYWLEV